MDKTVRTNTKYNPEQLIRDHSRMVQVAKTRPRLRVTLWCTDISCHVAILLCLNILRNYQQENRIISLTCTSGVTKKLRVLFTEKLYQETIT